MGGGVGEGELFLSLVLRGQNSGKPIQATGPPHPRDPHSRHAPFCFQMPGSPQNCPGTGCKGALGGLRGREGGRPLPVLQVRPRRPASPHPGPLQPDESPTARRWGDAVVWAARPPARGPRRLSQQQGARGGGPGRRGGGWTGAPASSPLPTPPARAGGDPPRSGASPPQPATPSPQEDGRREEAQRGRPPHVLLQPGSEGSRGSSGARSLGARQPRPDALRSSTPTARSPLRTDAPSVHPHPRLTSSPGNAGSGLGDRTRQHRASRAVVGPSRRPREQVAGAGLPLPGGAPPALPLLTVGGPARRTLGGGCGPSGAPGPGRGFSAAPASDGADPGRGERPEALKAPQRRGGGQSLGRGAVDGRVWGVGPKRAAAVGSTQENHRLHLGAHNVCLGGKLFAWKISARLWACFRGKKRLHLKRVVR